MVDGAGHAPHGGGSNEVTMAFDAGAPAYDTLVGLNPGYHQHLRMSARRLAVPDRGAGRRILDIGCGTGASTAALLSEAPEAEIVGVDASAGMLEHAEMKSWPDNVRFVHRPVESLSQAELDGPFDAVFAAYLVRNLADPDTQLRRIRGLLRPGGQLAVHEYVAGTSLGDRARWALVCWGIVIPLAAVKGGGVGLYRHLWRSVATFDDAPAFARRLERAGFSGVRIDRMPGWQHGIEHTFAGRLVDEHSEPGT